MTEGDKSTCREIAREIIKEVLKEHITACPHHQSYLVTRARMIGLFFGVVIASGVSSGTIVAIVMKAMAGA